MGTDNARYRRRVGASDIPAYARPEVERQLDRLEVLDEEDPEYRLIVAYLDWMIALPWSESRVRTPVVRSKSPWARDRRET
jgi:ATP-dependent Lon protease